MPGGRRRKQDPKPPPDHVERMVTVLDNVKDAESVTRKYQAKGWEPVSYETLSGPPKSVRIKFRKPNK